MALKVLLVEDDDDNRALMAEVLASSGWDVLSASSGREGLRALSEHSVDVVVTDVGMPGMCGLEVAKAAKAIAPSVPVVVVTGFVEDDEVGRAKGKDVDAVLVKPVDPDSLTRAVSEVAQARRRA